MPDDKTPKAVEVIGFEKFHWRIDGDKLQRKSKISEEWLTFLQGDLAKAQEVLAQIKRDNPQYNPE